jgi:hypothetical protein
VRFELSAAPEWLTRCNCSVCRRTNGLWAHIDPDEAVVRHDRDATAAYVWGDKTLALHHCRTCGCVTHWTPFDPALRRMAVNCRMAAPEDVATIRIRDFDGAETWAFLD